MASRSGVMQCGLECRYRGSRQSVTHRQRPEGYRARLGELRFSAAHFTLNRWEKEDLGLSLKHDLSTVLGSAPTKIWQNMVE